MSNLLERLKARRYSGLNLFTNAVGAAGCAAAPAVVMPPQEFKSGTYTIGGPDKDIEEAIARIERLEGYAERLERIITREAAGRDQRWLESALRIAKQEELGAENGEGAAP